MEEFSICITESISRIEVIEADCYEDALAKVQQMYNDGEIVLDHNDVFDVIID